MSTISVPTLVLHGADDGLIPRDTEFTAELIEGARFVVFEGMGHNLPEEVMPEIVSNMLAHLSAG